MSEEYHFGESRHRITGLEFEHLVFDLCRFYCQQQAVPAGKRFSGMPAIEAVIAKINSGQNWLTVADRGMIDGAESRWKAELEAAQAQADEAEAARAEVLRALEAL